MQLILIGTQSHRAACNYAQRKYEYRRGGAFTV